jgi:hypothetical protein
MITNCSQGMVSAAIHHFWEAGVKDVEIAKYSKLDEILPIGPP